MKIIDLPHTIKKCFNKISVLEDSKCVKTYQNFKNFFRGRPPGPPLPEGHCPQTLPPAFPFIIPYPLALKYRIYATVGRGRVGTGGGQVCRQALASAGVTSFCGMRNDTHRLPCTWCTASSPLLPHPSVPDSFFLLGPRLVPRLFQIAIARPSLVLVTYNKLGVQKYSIIFERILKCLLLICSWKESVTRWHKWWSTSRCLNP